ncbi:hypothetical protein ACEPAH_758 [Sanghuangporus vaninii]
MSSLEVTNLFSVKDKVVLVTGGSRGIGKMIATGFVRNGAKVYVSSRSAQACEETAKELTTMGPGECISIPADMQKLSDIQHLISELSAKESKLHVLINNAGATWAETIDEYPDSAFTKVLTLNLQRVFNLTQKCLPLLRVAALDGGRDGESWKDPARIINIGSIEGVEVPSHETYAYSASKAALHHLSKAFAGRLGYQGITSNTIACGPFQSKMMRVTLETIGAELVKGIPMSRIGSPEDIAGAALYLASRAGAYVNGATIVLDGGNLVSSVKYRL